MRVKRKTAVKLLGLLGYLTAPNWTDERITEKLNNISSLLKDNEELKSEKANELLEKIVKNQGQIEIVNTVDNESEDKTMNEEVKPQETEVTEKAPKKTSKKERARFGAMLSSAAGQIENAIAERNTVGSIAEATNGEIKKGRITAHLKYLVKKGVLKEENKEYVLV